MYHDLFLDLMYMYTYVDLAMVWMDAHTDTHTETYIHILTPTYTIPTLHQVRVGARDKRQLQGAGGAGLSLVHPGPRGLNPKP